MREKPRDKNDFTEKEVEVIKISASGMNRLEMAAAVGMCDNTFGSHLKEIFKHLGIHNITSLANYARKMGYV